MMKPFTYLLIITCFFVTRTSAQPFLSEKNQPGSFPVAAGGLASALCVDEQDDWLVKKAAGFFQNDIQSVTGLQPALLGTLPQTAKNIIVIGTTRSNLIKQLVNSKKINIDSVQGKWETYQLQLVSKPFKGIENALVIAGSDKRGVAYGIFELSQQMGVSPWYWWADVPVKKKKAVFVSKGTYLSGPPSVKYRGIFINDEAPAFSGWTKEKFGGVNHQVYEKMFELLLRLKANYLWPAMWANAFNDDDTLNPVLADKYGIVMGTSHHEPMLRAQQEWKRYGSGQWDYDSNATTLRAFWRKGIQNMGTHESIVTIGMRGDGDKPMSTGTATALLEKIVKDQRTIIGEVTGKSPAATPQLWALYKEVQDYYDKGMRVPDDVTLLLCDDNWGNIRKLPKLTDKPRTGGYGIYYHFDYVGGPRNYKWINTNNIARTWEQMHLAYEHGVDKIWIVNVGDLKPMEFPISFFLDYAWNTKKWNEDNLRDYYTGWAAQQFGDAHAKAIGDIIRKYSQYVARRKPELLSAETYNLANYNEADRVVAEYKKLLSDAEAIEQAMTPAYRDAYFELVLHPVKALANLQEMYVAVAKNKLYAAKGDVAANQWADKARQLYQNDSLITIQYNKLTAGGKWNHMMDQTHIGYTYWQQPPVNKMPDLRYVKADSVTRASYKDVKAGAGAGDASGYSHLSTKKTAIFEERDRCISMEAEHYNKAVAAPGLQWKLVPDIGRTASGLTVFPVTAAVQKAGGNSLHTEYNVVTSDTGKVVINAYFSPTLNFNSDPEGLQYAISIDGEQPQVISINKDDNGRSWDGWVANNIIIKSSTHRISKAGSHVIRYWMVSPGVVLQKLVLDLGGARPSYLGVPETISGTSTTLKQ